MVRGVRVWRWQEAGVLALVLLCVGCGQGGIDVIGEVTYDGAPLDSGSIVFIPADGIGPSRGTAIIDGKFALQGSGAPTEGKKVVKITGSMKTGKKIQAAPPAPAGMMVDELIYVRPPTQEREIVEGESESLSFALTSANQE